MALEESFAETVAAPLLDGITVGEALLYTGVGVGIFVVARWGIGKLFGKK